MADENAVSRKAISDEALVRLAKSGDQQALGYLISQYGSFIRMRASQFDINGFDKEDLAQEGTIGLINAIRSFDAQKGASFHTYAFHCISTKIISAVRTALRKKQQPLNGYISLDDASAAGRAAFCSVVDPEDMVLNREAMNAVNYIISNSLSLVERKILALYLAGCSYSEIAGKLHLGEKYIDNSLQKVKKKLGVCATV